MSLALWECECGTVTIRRPRWKPGEPEHLNCYGRMIYIRDIP